MKIRTRLSIFFLLISVVPLLLAAGAFSITAKEKVSQQIGRRLNFYADFIRSWLTTEVSDTSFRLGSLAKSPQLVEALAGASAGGSDRTILTKLLRFAQLSVPGPSRLELYDSTGRLVADSEGGSEEGDLRRRTSFPYLQELEAPNAPTQLALIAPTEEGGFAFHVAIPVIAPQGGLGFLLIRSDLSVITDLLRRATAFDEQDHEEIVFVLRQPALRKAVLLGFRSGEAMPITRTVDLDAHDAPLPSAGTDVTVHDLRDENDRRVLAVQREIPELGAAIVLRVDRDEVFAPVTTVFLTVLSICSLLLIASTLAFRLLSRSLTGPLTSFLGAVSKLEAGDLNAKVEPQPIHEFSELRQAFDSMTRQLQNSKGLLEQEVEIALSQEKRARALMASNLDAVVCIDENGKIFEWNAAAEQLFGFSRSEVLDREMCELLVPPPPSDPNTERFRRFCSEQSTELLGVRTELILLNRQGERVPVELAISEAMIGPERTFTCFIRDLRHEKQAQLQSLWYGSILKHSQDGIIGTNLDSKIILWNDASTRLFGYTSEEALGENIDIIVPPDRLPEERSAFEELSRGEPVEAIETIRRKKSGELVDVSLSISPIIGRGGEFIGAAKIVRDISKRRAEEKRFQLVVEAAPTAMIMVDPSGRIELVNVHAEKLFGYTRPELLGTSIERLVPEEFPFGPERSADGFFSSSGTRSLGKGRDLFARRKDGTRFPVEIGLNPVTTEKGPVILSSIVDITDRKRTEDFIRSALHEKELLLKEIHHRVKNNLQVISSLLRLQGDFLPDETSRALFKQCDDRVRSMALIHERLYRSEVFSEIDVSEYMRELAGSLIRSYAMRASKVKLETKLMPVSLGIDKAIPCGLLLNEFISNALKHAFDPEKGGVLTLVLEQHALEVTLIVRDDGRGLPERWEPEKSTTLGFQIVRTLVDQLGGTLEIERENGTAFVLRFEADSASDRRKNGGQAHPA